MRSPRKWPVCWPFKTPLPCCRQPLLRGGSISTLNGGLLQEDLPSAFATSSSHSLHSAVHSAAAKISAHPADSCWLRARPQHQPGRVEAFLSGGHILSHPLLSIHFRPLQGCRVERQLASSPVPHQPPSHRPPRRPLPAHRPRPSRRDGGLLRSFCRSTGAGMIRVGAAGHW